MVQWTLVWAGIGVLTAILGALLGWIVFPAAVHEKIIEVCSKREVRSCSLGLVEHLRNPTPKGNEIYMD